jgi:hypothetical protein
MRKDCKVGQYNEQLQNAGIKVYTTDLNEPPAWFYTVKDNKIAYFEAHSFGEVEFRFNFSTVHKPNEKTGTGVAVFREGWKPKVSHVIDTMEWQYPNHLEHTKYQGWDEFIKRNQWRPFVEIVLI